MSSSPRKGNLNGSPRASAKESKGLQLVETKPPWNWAFWSRAKQPASGPLSPTGESLSTVRERRTSSDSSLSRQNSSKGKRSPNRVAPADKAETLLQPIWATVGPGALVEATVYTREIEVETKLPEGADPEKFEKLLEGAFGQFREGKIFPQSLDGAGQLSRRSSEEKNGAQGDRLVVRDFTQPDIHFPLGGSGESAKDRALFNRSESFSDGTYRIEESSDNEVPLLELPAWKTTEVRGDTMTMRTQYLSAKGVSKEKPIPDEENQRSKGPKAAQKITQLTDGSETLKNKQVESGEKDVLYKAELEHEAFMEVLKGQKLLIQKHDKSMAENLQMKDEVRKKQAAILSYETKLQALQLDLERHQEDTAQLENYKREVEHQKELRMEMEKQIGILSAPDPALNEVAQQNSMLLRRLQEERFRRSKAEGKVRSLTRQVNSLSAKSKADEAAASALQDATSDLPATAQDDPTTSSTAKDDLEDYHLVIDNYLFSPSKREEWMEKEGILLKEGAIDMKRVVHLVDSYHVLQKRYADLQKQFKQQDGQPEQSAPGDSEVLSVRALNQKCEALLSEVDELRKSREEMEAHIEKLKEMHRSTGQTSSSSGSMLENLLRQEESRREVEEAKVQVLTEQVKELQEVQSKSEGMYGQSRTVLPLQEQALNIGVFAMAQLIMLSYGFGAWLEMMLIPLYGRFPT